MKLSRASADVWGASGPLLILLPCLAGCAAPRRYADDPEIKHSAQRAVVDGRVQCERLWQTQGFAGAVVELFVDGESDPIARGTTERDGRFCLSSAFLHQPDRGGYLRVSSLDWEEETRLPGFIDQTYSVIWNILCPEDRPTGVAVLTAVIETQTPPLRLPEPAPYGRVYWFVGGGYLYPMR
jgi:hypothetical protein